MKDLKRSTDQLHCKNVPHDACVPHHRQNPSLHIGLGILPAGTGYGREFASVFFILQEIFDLMVKENNRFKSLKGSGNLGLESYGKAILMPTGTKNEWLD
jgi:hypothetical protein